MRGEFIHKMKVSSLFTLLVVACFAMLLPARVSAQQSSIRVYGKVTENDKKLQGAIVTVYANGSLLKTLNVDGKYELNLELGVDYVIAYTKPGFITKRIEFNTQNVPADRAKNPFSDFPIDIDIFPEVPGTDIDKVLQQPIGKILYDPTYDKVGDFNSDEAYHKSIQSLLDQIEKARKDAEAKAKELEAQYQKAIKKADAEFTAKDYTNAKSDYETASTVKPGEQYPKDQIAAIDKAIKDASSSAQAATLAAQKKKTADSLTNVQKAKDATAAALAAQKKRTADSISNAQKLAAALAAQKKKTADSLAAAQKNAAALADAKKKRAADSIATAQKLAAAMVAQKKKTADSLAAVQKNAAALADAQKKRTADSIATAQKLAAAIAAQKKKTADSLATAQKNAATLAEAQKKRTTDSIANAQKLAAVLAAQKKKTADSLAAAQKNAAALADTKKKRAADSLANAQRLASANAAQKKKTADSLAAAQKNAAALADAKKKRAADSLANAQKLAAANAVQRKKTADSLVTVQKVNTAMAAQRKKTADSLAAVQNANEVALADVKKKRAADSIANSQKMIAANAAQKKRTVDSLAAAQKAAIAALADAKKKHAADSIAALQKGTDDKYNSTLAKANQYYLTKNYKPALTAYQQASAIKPTESLPKQRIAQIQQILANQQQSGQTTTQVHKTDTVVKATNDPEAKDSLALKYPQGTTEEHIDEPGCEVTRRIVIKGPHGWVYTRKVWSWGQTYYFKGEQPITESTWTTETTSSN